MSRNNFHDRLVWLNDTRQLPFNRSHGVRSRYRRSLRVEPLEDRRLLSITVDTLVDEYDGSILDGDLSRNP
jgi:hypothetical protein